MARISSTTLFNFTNKIEFLIDNLSNGFYCSNTYEKIKKNIGYCVPMACFCDIPLSLIKEHFDWYGSYGIGLKRSYARELGVHPVWYVTSENKLIANLVNKRVLTQYEKKHLLPYMKQFLGYQSIETGEIKRKKFYDEREWRYIPDNSLVEPMFGINKNTAITKMDKINERMPLDLNHIEYIIIKDENDIEKMLKVLKKLSLKKGIRYEILVSKLITSKQIIKDF